MTCILHVNFAHTALWQFVQKSQVLLPLLTPVRMCLQTVSRFLNGPEPATFSSALCSSSSFSGFNSFNKWKWNSSFIYCCLLHVCRPSMCLWLSVSKIFTGCLLHATLKVYLSHLINNVHSIFCGIIRSYGSWLFLSFRTHSYFRMEYTENNNILFLLSLANSQSAVSAITVSLDGSWIYFSTGFLHFIRYCPLNLIHCSYQWCRFLFSWSFFTSWRDIRKNFLSSCSFLDSEMASWGREWHTLQVAAVRISILLIKVQKDITAILLLSAATQHFKLYLSGLFSINWMYLYLIFLETNCSSTVIFSSAQ